jgi:type II secretory pathway component GspD/PulD (secretin)/tetratricopeptide (TPR) repeat protein
MKHFPRKPGDMKSGDLRLSLRRSRLVLLLAGLSACGSPPTQPDNPPAAPPTAAATADEPVPAWLEQYNQEAAAIAAGKPLPPKAPPVVPLPAASQPVVPTPAPPVATEPAATEPAESEPADAGQEAPPPAPVQQPVQQPVQELGAADIPRMLELSRQHAALVDDRVAALVAHFLELGIAAMDAGDLEAAHEHFGNAYELDPTDPAARDLFERTGALLGKPGAALAAAASSAHDRAGARQEQARLEIQSLVEQGRHAMLVDDPETALRRFEDALVLLKATPGAQDGSLSEASLAAMVSTARVAARDAESRRDIRLIDLAQQRQEELDAAEGTRTERQVVALMDSADAAFLRDDFLAAEAAYDQVLAIDPGNEDAENRKRIASQARHTNITEMTRVEYRNQWQDTFDELEHEFVPPVRLIDFPDAEEWAEIVDRGSKQFAPEQAEGVEVDSAVRDRLQKAIPVNFQEEPLEAVLTHLQAVSGVNFLLSPTVRDAGSEQTYTLEDRSPQPIERILKIVLEDLSLPPLTYTIRDGVVRIITQDEARNDYTLEMYDIRDLTFIPKDYKAEDYNLLPSGTDKESYSAGVEDDEPLPSVIGADALLTLISDNIAKDSWTADPNRTIQLLPGTLVVRQTPDVQLQIKTLLDDLRVNTSTMINIETRFVEVEDSFLEDIGVDLRGLDGSLTGGFPLEDFGQSGAGGFGTPNNPTGIGTGNDPGFFDGSDDGDLKGRIENLFDFTLGESGTLNNAGGLSMQALFLNDANVEAVLHAVTKYETSNVVNAPSLTLRSGQRGNVKALTNRTYVRDFEPEIAQAAVIAQPELDNVREGVMLDVRAVASADRRFVTLELRPTVIDLVPDASGNPLPQATVSLGTQNSSNVTIELPELRVQRLRTTATIPDGATLMLGGLKTAVEEDMNSGVPFVSDIPIVGSLFSRNGEYTSKRKLIILLKATILAPAEQEPERGFTR